MLTSWEAQKTIVNGLKQYISNEINNTYSNEQIEPQYDDIPIVCLNGAIPTDKTELHGQLDYASKMRQFHAYTRIKCQGGSTTAYPKKNFSIELFVDEGCSIPLNESFRKWGEHNNYVLKANYIDPLHSRNIVCANLWADIVRSRADFDSLPVELKNSPNMGAIDGFPIKVYANGNYEGLYTWNIPKCDWQFGLDTSNINHVLLSSEFNDNGLVENETNPCNFNAYWDGNEKYWSVDVGVLSAGLIENLNSGIIQPVINADATSLENSLDIQSAIDYFIFQDVIGGIDGLAKNMLLVTYDMNKWYMSAYDLDATFDLWWEGGLRNNPTIVMPNEYLNKYSELQYAIFNLYHDKLLERYKELRNTVLSASNITSMFERFNSVANEDIRIMDTLPYPDIPDITGNTMTALRNFILARLAYLDNEYRLGV